jgi:hypothetical protein
VLFSTTKMEPNFCNLRNTFCASPLLVHVHVFPPNTVSINFLLLYSPLAPPFLPPSHLPNVNSENMKRKQEKSSTSNVLDQSTFFWPNIFALNPNYCMLLPTSHYCLTCQKYSTSLIYSFRVSTGADIAGFFVCCWFNYRLFLVPYECTDLINHVSCRNS